MELKKGELHIWNYTSDEKDFEQEKLRPILSAEERRRANDFVYEKDAAKYICNHVFRKHVLAKYLSIPASKVQYAYTNFGKPYLENANINFSHSYRSNKALLAIYLDATVGIDLEEIKTLQDPKTFTEYSFSKEENEHIFRESTMNEDVLFTYWTFKEAYIKATGTGLNVDISQLNLADFYEQETNALSWSENKVWTIKRLNAANGFKAAFAVEGDIESCRQFNYN
jgi:4'-phosphopantetheinyl transferase